MSTIWLAPPLTVWEGEPLNFPALKTDSGLDPIVLGAAYGSGDRMASDATSKFTKWISQSPRNGVYKGGVDLNSIFGDPAFVSLKSKYLVGESEKFSKYNISFQF
jgi:hypothetical protein